MADKKISALTGATTPLAGTEVLPIVQGGSTVKVSIANLTAGRAVTASSFTVGTTAVYDISFPISGVVGFPKQVAGPSYPFAFDHEAAAYGQMRLMSSNTSTNTLNKTIMAFNQGGDVAVSAGNLVVGTAAKGIDFSANTNAPGMTSELLNDYEEGTWTPTDGSGAGLTFTGTSGNCFYTKVGNLVTCTFALVYPTTADLNGAKLAGLPFTSKATSNSVSGGFITYTNSALTIAPLVGANDTGVNLFLNTGNAAGNNQLSTFILRGIITYMV